MAAIRRFPDAQTRIFDFQNLASASARSPDVNITQKENSHQAASGSTADLQLRTHRIGNARIDCCGGPGLMKLAVFIMANGKLINSQGNPWCS